MSSRPDMPPVTRRAALALFASAAAVGAGGWAAPAFAGVDLSAMDPATKPGDDFFRYANGGWLDRYQLRDDEVYAGGRTRISDLRRDRVRAIIETAAAKPSAPASLEGQIGALYASYMDQPARDAAGLVPLAPDMARIEAVSSLADLMALFGEAPAAGLASPFEASLFYDFHEPGRMRYTLAPGGLGLPTREHYLEPRHAETLAAYRAYVAEMLALAGAPDPAAAAATVVDLETRLAKVYWPTAEAYDFLKTANNLTIADLAALTPGFPWDGFLAAAGASGLDLIIVRQPSAMRPVADVVAATPLPVWKDYLRFHLVSDNAEYLDARTEAARFGFYSRRLQGQKTPRPKWSRGVDLVEGYMGQQLGRLYVERHFPPQAKDRIAAIFDNIRAVMRERIVRAQWMSETTRAEALRKVDTLVVKIGFPDRWPAFPAYDFRKADLYGNLRRGRRVRWGERIAQAKAPIERDLWQTTPQATSAAANPGLNEVTVPAGTLEPPFFDRDADPAANYGAIGGVLGHELGHMFDALGRKFDATGKLRDWWAPADAARYEAIAAKVEKQYSGFEALPGQFVNGRQTLNENIADISGLGVAFDAWRRSLGGKPSPVISGLTGEQRFFLGWAQMRVAKEREAFLSGQLLTGVHSPDRFRVNGPVRNLDAWYAAFDVKPGDRLYLAPQDRAKFW